MKTLNRRSSRAQPGEATDDVAFETEPTCRPSVRNMVLIVAFVADEDIFPADIAPIKLEVSNKTPDSGRKARADYTHVFEQSFKIVCDLHHSR
jgi:hypothetical protein